MKYLVIILFISFKVFASDVVDPGRLPYGGSFSNIIGVTGGIPTGQTIYTNFSSSDSMATIKSGYDNCPSNQVVLLAAGTYTYASSLFLKKDGVVLRGSVDGNGRPSTIFNGPFISILEGDPAFDTSNPGVWNTVAVNAGATRGSTTITLASIPSGCSNGALLWLSAPVGGAISGGSFALFLGTDPFVQIVKVIGVSGNDVTFFPAINADFLTSLRASTTTKTVYHRQGIENIAFGNGQTVYIQAVGCDEPWIKNCIFSNSPAGSVRQVWWYTCNRPEIRHCKLGDIDAAGSNAYAEFGQDCTGLWTEDNIFTNAPNFFPQLGAQNCMFSYNVGLYCPYAQSVGFLSQIVYNHGCFCCFDGYEGNVIPQYYDDGTNNNPADPTSTRANVHLRENIVDWDPSDGGKLYNCQGVTILDPGVSNTIVGCLIGKVGFTTLYDRTGSGSTPKSCYDLVGQVDAGRYGNWNAVDQGVRASEALSVGQTIAVSYIRSSKPAFFGSLNYPPFDPANNTDAQRDMTNIPAGYRLVFGVDPPASPSTFYVATNGSTGNDGLTFGSPWPMYYALTNAAAGSTLIFETGSYTNIDLDRQSQQGMTLRSFVKWGAKVTGASGLHNIATESSQVLSNVVVDGFEVIGSYIDGIKFTGPGCSASNNWVHFCTNGASCQGIAAHNVNGTIITRNLIEWNGTDIAHDHGIYVNGTNIQVTANVLRYNKHYGAQFFDGTGDNMNCLIANNLIYSNGLGMTLWSYAGYTNTITGNTILSSTNSCIVINGGNPWITNNILQCGGSYYPIDTNGTMGSTAKVDYNFNSKSIAPVGPHDTVSSTPGFLSPATGLYWLTAGAAATGAQISTVFAPVDFFGNAQASVAAVGAFQYNPVLAVDIRVLDPSPAAGADYWNLALPGVFQQSSGIKSVGDIKFNGTVKIQ